ncbi:Hypothetical protein FKW44_025031, partial [Caligus rogercresseyi]
MVSLSFVLLVSLLLFSGELSSPWDSFDLERLIGGDSSSSSLNELDEQPQIVMCGRNLFRVLMAAC